ncbi:hypothetical protein W03_05850 [Nitrosomonas sp. PY1]|uniref:hypothetical protein n=1 Tax=Nitrosomonas sp. PY1 TaxID=1803906 RepID=UPI001FC86DA2|nr:hypothetical protein [Nitrosomonas sp. PY1]GKS68581.1 hypothetical protein W03_05850 [Nitrosomonas sp. PY1]
MVPRDIARATNAAAYEKIGSYSGKKKVGVLIMDFPGEWVIYRTIKTNFASSVACSARTYRTESDASWAEFRLPGSAAGTVIKITGGAYNHYVFPKCNRVTWTDLAFTCGNDGQWTHTGSWDADAYCTSSNTSQSYLAVGDR